MYSGFSGRDYISGMTIRVPFIASGFTPPSSVSLTSKALVISALTFKFFSSALSVIGNVFGGWFIGRLSPSNTYAVRLVSCFPSSPLVANASSTGAIFPGTGASVVPPGAGGSFGRFLPVVVRALTFFGLGASCSRRKGGHSFGIPFVCRSVGSTIRKVLTLIHRGRSFTALSSSQGASSFL